jgi:dTDP-4-dehydrorhamnose 3,5-epimerase-like enzyme
MIKKKKINQKDKRGYILDIFINNPKDHCTLVTFNKSSIRGNHYHKKSVQYSFILEGKFLMIISRVDKKGQLIGKKVKKIVKQNDLIIHKPFHAHAFKAKIRSKMLAFVDGIRGGKNYEKDTFRLEKKLI